MKDKTRAVEIRAEVLTWTNCRLTLGELKRWERNPAAIGKAEAARLVESFDEFGQVQALAIDPENRLVDGHQRLDTWIAEFGPECVVDCRRASRLLTDKEREKLAVYLRSATVGHYNWDELANWEAGDLQAWGMDQSTLDAWDSNAGALRQFIESNKPPVPEAPEAETDRAEELRQKWGVELGQLWIIPSKSGQGEHRLICGDCTDRAVVERVMGGDRAQLILTSPPYGVGMEYEGEPDEGTTVDLVKRCFKNVCGFIDPDRFAFVNFGERYIWSKPMTQIYHEAFTDIDWRWYDQRFWKRSSVGMAIWNTTQPRAMSQVEYLFTFQNGTKSYPVHDLSISKEQLWSDEGSSTGIAHPAVMAAGVAEKATTIYTDASELVIDPFCGSGTTIIACEQLARQCRAIEIAPQYVAVSLERLAAMGLEPCRAE
jgi:DNA modification methylase